jgi:hypothetical protein
MEEAFFMSDERTILDYLEDISNAILDIRSFVHDMSADRFVADKKTFKRDLQISAGKDILILHGFKSNMPIFEFWGHRV